MKCRLLLLFVLALGLGPGCDVATVALLMNGDDGSDDDGDPLTAPLPPPVFSVWRALLVNTNKADEQYSALVTAEGNPSTAVWTLVGDSTATKVFDPPVAANSFNAILITASSSQDFNLDSVEILDANNIALETASGTVWSNLVNDADRFTGPPDGRVAVTAGSGAIRAFIFTVYSGPIDKIRINGHPPGAPGPGDVAAVGSYSSPSAERPGGLAVRSSDGVIHVTLSVGDVGRLVRFNAAGTFQDHVEITNDLATAGSHSVALTSAGVIFTSASIGAGTIQVRLFASDLSPGAIRGFSSGSNSDRVEHNSITLDSSGNVVVVGGMNSIITSRDYWAVKLPGTVTGTIIWESNISDDNGTYWYAVAAGPNDEVLTTGDQLSSLIGGTQLVYSSRFNDAGTQVWDDSFNELGAANDVGRAIALDAGGNIYVAGSVGTDADALDPVLLRYGASGNLTAAADFTAAGNGNDEILDIAIDTDGAIYVVGYVTVSGQGENAFIRKYTYDTTFSSPVWERTHHGGFGNDRAISCAIHGTTLVVAGYETNSTGQTKLVLRTYEK